MKDDEAPARLIPNKPETEIAADLKKRINDVLNQVCPLMDEAAKAGFLVRWAGINPGQFGRHEVFDLHLLKRF